MGEEKKTKMVFRAELEWNLLDFIWILIKNTFLEGLLKSVRYANEFLMQILKVLPAINRSKVKEQR